MKFENEKKRHSIFTKLLAPFLIVNILSHISCGKKATESDNVLNITFELERLYTGKEKNLFTINADNIENDNFDFFLYSENVSFDIASDVGHDLVSKTIEFMYSGEGVKSVDFKIEDTNGSPYVHQVLAWEYSKAIPIVPVISFKDQATKSRKVNLLVSDNRSTNTTAIWVGGDIVNPNGTLDKEGGYWQNISIDSLSVPLTLTSGDGVKTISTKYANIYGNFSEESENIQIVLKQNPPQNCRLQVQSTTINDSDLKIKLWAEDPYPLSFSAFGDVQEVINSKAFSNGDEVVIPLINEIGIQNTVLTIQDFAGNICLEQDVEIEIDPDFESEGIWFDGTPYWTTDENISVQVYFDYYEGNEPLEVKLTGDVTGDFTNSWQPYGNIYNIKLTSGSGSKRVYAQYRNSEGTESYLISKRIFLNPSVSLTDAGSPFKNVSASNIPGVLSLTINGCKETYNNVAYTENYICETEAATVEVTYKFKKGNDLTLTN